MRKRGKPRKHLDPMGCINMRMPLNEKHGDALATCYWSALDGFIRGYGNRSMWQSIADALNISRKLCDDGIGDSHLDFIIAAQLVAQTCATRFKKVGVWELNQAEASVIDHAFRVIDAQNEITSPLRMRGALREVKKSIARGDRL